MADFYSILTGSFDEDTLNDRSARRLLYARARQALETQLRAMDPPLPDELLGEQRQALADAIERIETELSAAPAETAAEPGRPEQSAPDAEAPAETAAEDGSAAQPASDAEATAAEAAAEDGSAAQPASDAEAPAAEAAAEDGSAAQPASDAEAQTKADRVQIETEQERQAIVGAGAIHRETGSSAHKPFQQGASQPPRAAGSQTPVADKRPGQDGATQRQPGHQMAPREDTTGKPSPGDESNSLGWAAEKSFRSAHTPVLDSEQVETRPHRPVGAARDPRHANVTAGDTALRARDTDLRAEGMARRTRDTGHGADDKVLRDRRPKSRFGYALIASLLCAVVGVGAYAYAVGDPSRAGLERMSHTMIGWVTSQTDDKITDRSNGTAGADSQGSQTTEGTTPASSDAGTAARPTLEDNAASATRDEPLSNPPAQAWLLIESLADGDTDERHPGVAYWEFDRSDQALTVNARIPELNRALSIKMKENSDASLPASHTMEFNYTAATDDQDGLAVNFPALIARTEENQEGAQFRGAGALIIPGQYLLGLFNDAAARSHNERLLKSGKWLVSLIQFSSGRRGLIVIERGQNGDAAIQEALASWGS